MIKTQNTQILEFLSLLRESFDGAERVYTEGSCYRLYLILKHLYPQAVALYDPIIGHVYIDIDRHVYDIKGEYLFEPGKLCLLEKALGVGQDPMEWKWVWQYKT